MQAESVDHDSFSSRLERIPRMYGLLTAALASVLGLFAPDRLVPEPLGPFRLLVSLIIVVAFISAWAWRGAVKRRARWIAGITGIVLVLFAVMNVLFVREVRYSPTMQGQQIVHVRTFVTGWRIGDPELQGMTAEDAIRHVGDSWGDLVTIWGGSFVLVGVSYMLLYLLLVSGVVCSIGTTGIAHPSKTTGPT